MSLQCIHIMLWEYELLYNQFTYNCHEHSQQNMDDMICHFHSIASGVWTTNISPWPHTEGHACAKSHLRNQEDPENLRAVWGHGILDCYSVPIPSRIRIWEVIDPPGCTSCLLAYFLTALLLACNNGPPFTDVFANHMLTLNAHTYCCRKLGDKISMTIMT